MNKILRKLIIHDIIPSSDQHIIDLSLFIKSLFEYNDFVNNDYTREDGKYIYFRVLNSFKIVYVNYYLVDKPIQSNYSICNRDRKEILRYYIEKYFKIKEFELVIGLI